jgi:hypothetical protein
MIAQVNRTGLNICELTYAHYIFFLSAVFTVPFTKDSYLYNLIKKIKGNSFSNKNNRLLISSTPKIVSKVQYINLVI